MTNTLNIDSLYDLGKTVETKEIKRNLKHQYSKMITKLNKEISKLLLKEKKKEKVIVTNMDKIRISEDKEREKALSTNNILFLKNSLLITEDEQEKIITEAYTRVITRQEFIIRNFERETWRRITNQDKESIEQYASFCIEQLTKYKDQWDYEKMSKLGKKYILSEILEFAKKTNTNLKEEDNKKWRITTESLDNQDIILQDDSQLEQLQDDINNKIILQSLSNIVHWDDMIFVLDYLKQEELTTNATRLRFKKIIDNAKDRTKHLQYNKEERKQQANNEQWIVKSNWTWRIKNVIKATTQPAITWDIFKYNKRLKWFNKWEINLVQLAQEIKQWTYTVNR